MWTCGVCVCGKILGTPGGAAYAVSTRGVAGFAVGAAHNK